MSELSPEILRELDPGHQAVRQIATEKIKAYINGVIRQEVKIIPGEPIEPDEFKGEAK